MVSAWWLPVLFFIGSFTGVLVMALMCLSGSQPETATRVARQIGVALSDKY